MSQPPDERSQQWIELTDHCLADFSDSVKSHVSLGRLGPTARHRLRRIIRQRQPKCECRAASLNARHREVALHEPCEATTDGQPEAGSIGAARMPAIDLNEWIE